jgi:hypothetical protein
MEMVEVGVARVSFRDAVDGAAGSDAIGFHPRDDVVLRPGGAGQHEERDDDAEERGAGAELAHGAADGEENDQNAAGDKAFVMEDVEAFGDDGAGGVGVGDGAERCPGGNGKEEESAEPEDEREPDDGAEQGFHARQGTARGGEGAANQGTSGIGAEPGWRSQASR